ncbi:MAG: DUF6273 domain-containing protein [Synergistaceae bacterium]|nr:DUF6273 domain-containing protein [Synergistaceae bacterium]
MYTAKRKIIMAIFCTALLVAFGAGFAGRSSAAVGDVIKLGGFDWRVLEVKDGNALIISDKILSKGAYNIPDKGVLYDSLGSVWQDTPVKWEECTLRQYLNGQFYDSTFSNEEKGRIVETTIVNNDNPWFGMAGGNDTTDKVFLLSLEEVVLYFGDSGELGNRPKDADTINDSFNEKRIAETLDGNACRWLLRSPGLFHRMCDSNHVYAGCVAVNGYLSVIGEYVHNEYSGIRPAMWIKQ